MRDRERVVATVRKGPRNIIRIITSERNGVKSVTMRKFNPNGKGIFLPTMMVLQLAPAEARELAAGLVEAATTGVRK